MKPFPKQTYPSWSLQYGRHNPKPLCQLHCILGFVCRSNISCSRCGTRESWKPLQEMSCCLGHLPYQSTVPLLLAQWWTSVIWTTSSSHYDSGYWWLLRSTWLCHWVCGSWCWNGHIHIDIVQSVSGTIHFWLSNWAGPFFSSWSSLLVWTEHHECLPRWQNLLHMPCPTWASRSWCS